MQTGQKPTPYNLLNNHIIIIIRLIGTLQRGFVLHYMDWLRRGLNAEYQPQSECNFLDTECQTTDKCSFYDAVALIYLYD